MLPAGFALAGAATEAWGAALVCVAGGAVTVALHLAGLLHPQVRGLA